MDRPNLSFQNLASQLYNGYEKYYDPALTLRRTTHSDILPLILKRKKSGLITISEIGRSVEKRTIYQVKIGHGPVKILLWSQMHGDESTATRALFDIFNFFEQKDAEFEGVINNILENCTLYFVPMLNPDGAEQFIRRNALGIDLNRDALRLQSPEAVLLKKLQNELRPAFGYNLHDQSPRYAVGNTGQQTTMAFLATAYNEAREINPIRKRSMQLIAAMNRDLQKFIPYKVARFSDEFEPRAFGDNIQKWGTTLILVESGGLKGDPEKQYIRKLNFVTILSSVSSIAHKNYENEPIEAYFEIPENNRVLFDLLIRNAKMVVGSSTINLDIGINKEEIAANVAKKYRVKSSIEDLGDLSTFFGIEEIDATDLEVIAEKPLILGQKANFDLKKGQKIKYSIKNGSII